MLKYLNESLLSMQNSCCQFQYNLSTDKYWQTIAEKLKYWNLFCVSLSNVHPEGTVLSWQQFEAWLKIRLGKIWMGIQLFWRIDPWNATHVAQDSALHLHKGHRGVRKSGFQSWGSPYQFYELNYWAPPNFIFLFCKVETKPALMDNLNIKDNVWAGSSTMPAYNRY